MALEEVRYHHDDTVLTGWLARPAGPARGAIVLFPTIMNVNAPMERRAQMLADAGYVALIADFYGQPVADFAASHALAETLRADVRHYRDRIAAAVATLRAHEAAADLPVGAIGFCMGGQAVLELARDGADLDVVVSSTASWRPGARLNLVTRSAPAS
jgi:dienelactone hydrolase